MEQKKSLTALGIVIVILLVGSAGWVLQNQWLQLGAMIVSFVLILATLAIITHRGEIKPERLRQSLITIVIFVCIVMALIFFQK